MCYLRTFIRITLLLAFIIPLTSCKKEPTPVETPVEMAEWVADPTPANNLPDLIANLSSDDPRVRFVSANALDRYGKEALIAVPSLINNLDYTGASDVRQSAAAALGKLGPDAREAVPKLLAILRNEQEDYQVCDAVVRTLGKIKDKTAVPMLIGLLYKDDRISKYLWPISAKSVAQITGEKFEDLDDYVFDVNEDGELYIVIDAKRWWEESGQYQDWTKP